MIIHVFTILIGLINDFPYSSVLFHLFGTIIQMLHSHQIPPVHDESSNGNVFRVTGPLCGEFTGRRWIPRTQRPVTRSLMFPLIYTWLNGWINNREAGDLRRHRAHCDAIVLMKWHEIQRNHLPREWFTGCSVHRHKGLDAVTPMAPFTNID